MLFESLGEFEGCLAFCGVCGLESLSTYGKEA